MTFIKSSPFRAFCVTSMAAALGACATAPTTSGTNLPVEAAPVANPTLPNIHAIAWLFRNGSEQMCGITQDKGIQTTPLGTTTLYAKLAEGGYGLKVEGHNTHVVVRINGNDVYGTGGDGAVGKLNADQAQVFLDTLAAQRTTCAKLISETTSTLPKAVGSPLRPGLTVTLKDGFIQQVSIIGDLPSARP